jgi:hypothetical protein
MLAELTEALESAEESRPSHHKNTKASRVRRCKKLASLGRYRDATKALVAQGVASSRDAQVREDLKAKNPTGELMPVPHGPPPSPLVATIEQVQAALFSFPVGTACGASGLRAQHILDAVRGKVTQDSNLVLQNLTKLVNVLLAGRGPVALAAIIASAPLIPVLKPDSSLRPICVGEILRRLVSKVAARDASIKLASVLQKFQMGVGVPRGMDAIVHSLAALVEQHAQLEGRSVLLIDFRNAFPSISRRHFFRVVREECPDIAAWVEYIYGSEAYLFFDDLVIPSKCGLHQGDPLAPVLFALVLHVLAKKIEEECPNLELHAWYLDDGTLVGDTEELLRGFDVVCREGPELGLNVRLDKCEL